MISVVDVDIAPMNPLLAFHILPYARILIYAGSSRR